MGKRIKRNIPSPGGEGSSEKIVRTKARASFVARGRGKFMPPRPGGRCMAVKHFLYFRRATPATCEDLYKIQTDDGFGLRGLNTAWATESKAPVWAA
jgi:hypothetical protein